MSDAPPRPSRWQRTSLAALCLLAAAAPLSAQPATPAAIEREPVALSYSSRHFDGVMVDTVVLTAKSVQFVTDTLGAWTPFGEGSTDAGFVFRHRRHAQVFITLTPFKGAGPGKDDDEWRSYRWEVSAQLGAETKITDLGEAGTAGGIPSFGSWTTREALFETPLPGKKVVQLQRHVVATDGKRGVIMILSGPASEVAAVEQDFRFLLARLERNDPVRVASR